MVAPVVGESFSLGNLEVDRLSLILLNELGGIDVWAVRLCVLGGHRLDTDAAEPLSLLQQGL